MKSDAESPSFDVVSADIGDKVINAMAASISGARKDFQEYRLAFPQWVADATERGLANWIHDRMWKHLENELFDVSSVVFSDNGVLREIVCGSRYRFRAKRHDEKMALRTYPTQAALEFYLQEPLDEMFNEVSLAYGYRWIADERRIGAAVMTLHNGQDLLWWAEMNEEETGWETKFTTLNPTQPDAGAPGIAIQIIDKEKMNKEAQGQ